MSKKEQNKKDYVEDLVKDLLKWIVVTALSFVYWVAMLLLASLFLLNVWHTSFEEILRISVVLMIVTSVGYLGILIFRRS